MEESQDSYTKYQQKLFYSSHSSLFYNVSKIPENYSKRTRKTMRGPAPESYIATGFSIFLLGHSSWEFVTKTSHSQTQSHQPSPHNGILYHSWHQNAYNHGNATQYYFFLPHLVFRNLNQSPQWVSSPQNKNVSRTCPLCSIHIITITAV